MINKKLSIIAMISVVAIASGFGIYELLPPTNTVYSGSAQFAERTFEEELDFAGIVFQGEVQSVGVFLHLDEYTETDENGNKVVFYSETKPHQEIIIKIDELYKDNYGLDGSGVVTVYDRHVNGEIGLSDGQKTNFVSKYAVEYKVGQKGLFLIENDSKLWLTGFSHFYQIDDENQKTIKTPKHEMFHEDHIDLKFALESAKKLGE